MKIAIIGAGPMGLTAAYDLTRAGHQVIIFEAEDRIGGMSASFDFDGQKIERYYHYVCGPDNDLFRLLEELGISDKLKWTNTKMGFFYDGQLYKWGTPFDLLFFPKIDLFSKIRYGWLMWWSSKRKQWHKLDRMDVISWLKKNIGVRAYQIFWESLFHYKFYELKHNLSAAWIWSRIRRMAKSRKNLFTEQLGYLAGGSDTLLNVLKEKIELAGGVIKLNTPVQKIDIVEHKIVGVTTAAGAEAFDAVISTIPLPYVPELLPSAEDELAAKYRAIQNIAVKCIVFKLTQKVSENFWMNINDPRMDIPGIIEYGNLVPGVSNVLYIPYYLPTSHPCFSDPDEVFYQKVEGYLAQINPAFTPQWITARRVFTLQYAQPVCPPNFLEILPPYFTGVQGLYVADTTHSYPEDRSIQESIRIAREITKELR